MTHSYYMLGLKAVCNEAVFGTGRERDKQQQHFCQLNRHISPEVYLQVWFCLKGGWSRTGQVP